jgi:hypothetical protein
MRAKKKTNKKTEHDELEGMSDEELMEIIELVLERRSHQSRFIDHLADAFSFSPFLESKKSRAKGAYLGFLEDRIMLSRDSIIAKNYWLNEEDQNS